MKNIIHKKSTWSPQTESYKNAIVLYDDNWNDFGYRTTFHMTFCDNNGEVKRIGDIKIYYWDFDEKRNLKYMTAVSTVLPDCIKQLSEKFCSLGQSLQFYQNLKKYLPNEYMYVLQRLNDIATNETLRQEFWQEDGVQTSLLRDSSAEKALYEAANLLLSNQTKENDISFTYSIEVPYSELDTEIVFDFSKTENLPFRMNALVGKNGTGKTQILAGLADSLSGLKDTAVQRNAKFVGKRPAVDKVISISFSAFDEFRKRTKEGDSDYYYSNSYVYCGIQSEKGTLSLEELHKNFKKSLQIIWEKGRNDAWENIMSELMEQEHISIIKNLMDRDEEKIHFSSGQHILVCTMTEVLANIENESILLFDEPELHLHPNAIANTMRMFYRLLEEFNSYAIIATHSPLIIQEIPSRYIRVLTRVNNILSIHMPDNECFGENVTKITDDIFDVRSTESNYKSVLKKLSQKMEYDEILALFEGKLSFNAMIYLKNCCTRGNEE